MSLPPPHRARIRARRGDNHVNSIAQTARIRPAECGLRVYCRLRREPKPEAPFTWVKCSRVLAARAYELRRAMAEIGTLHLGDGGG